MEKLSNKIFYTIFSIISTFLIVIVLIFNIQSYKEEYKKIESNLSRMNSFVRVPDKRPTNFLNDLNNRIILDYNVYTFILDSNNNILNRISHNENSLDASILVQAEKIIKENKVSKTKVGFLYFDSIAYNFSYGSYLSIIDIKNVRNELLFLLILSMSLFLVFEMLVYYLSVKITNWIIKPIKETFNKQREFIADASHELKTPLAVMMASVDCIPVNKRNEKWINSLKFEQDRMNNLITKLLDLSKSEIKKDDYELNNLSKIIEKTSLVFESLAFENNVEIVTNVNEDIMFNCNVLDIEELISILLDNAIKHSYEKTKIEVNLYLEKNNLIIDVINEGDEIKSSECEMIFERFYRSDESRNRNSNRYGLGLAIAKNIVENYYGKISAFSLNGKTTFRIIFQNKKH